MNRVCPMVSGRPPLFNSVPGLTESIDANEYFTVKGGRLSTEKTAKSSSFSHGSGLRKPVPVISAISFCASSVTRTSTKQVERLWLITQASAVSLLPVPGRK